MTATGRASGAAGLGFVLLLVVANLVLTSAGLPLPTDTSTLPELGRAHADGVDALRLASALMPAAWLLATVFAAGLAVESWHSPARRTWALVGLGGVLAQCATFAVAEAARLAVAAAALDGTGGEPGALAGLWGLHRAVFGFNQVFLATALLGFSLARPSPRAHAALGLTGAALLLASATAAPYGVGGAQPLALAGLAGWVLWLGWIAVAGVRLLRTGAHRAADRSAAGRV
ncbi:hypothetical protein J1G44_07210 [Cellulomonas sp. zg-ZUI199]|uniref:DUF4386 domain-containing protein n=1 Tax=Cellulomonas wangleii TaxID=2816956 RepID=A0ABX8D891_9CELL|nr:hypothetical protein [Cellulomonas wangleii]MBO0924271.1 hypothetical protein [Cellulomonas wangleii]QVI62282.1 hypothetical protein KG103_18055 [Cellulomonas wangleii]